MTTPTSNYHTRGRSFRTLWFTIAATLAVAGLTRPSAQSFSSGSDGSDGALIIPANQGTIIFDPFDTARWGKVLDADGDGVYNFTTITINSGNVVRLLGDRINRPVYWLATGDVVISPSVTIDLNGANGATNANAEFDIRRQLAVPGAGGYSGGAGGRASPAVAATPGEGPGGGSGGTSCPGIGWTLCGRGGTFTGNRLLFPLVGGSGGEGATHPSLFGFGGGAGGGAILIASSTSITVNGVIRADGGNGGSVAGNGSAGAIRLVAPAISGTGNFSVRGIPGEKATLSTGSPGWVRLEAFQLGTTFTFQPSTSVVTRGSPVDATTLRPTAALRIKSIDGIPIGATPSGTFTLPDVTINKGGPVNVEVEASGIPPGTAVTLRIYPETPEDPAVISLAAQAMLNGTLQSTTATVAFTFPYGFSRGYVRASWTQ